VRTLTEKGWFDVQHAPCGPGFAGHHTLPGSFGTASSAGVLSTAAQPSKHSSQMECSREGHATPSSALTTSPQIEHSSDGASSRICALIAAMRPCFAASRWKRSSWLHAQEHPENACINNGSYFQIRRVYMIALHRHATGTHRAAAK
jgi:hypothetical protein